MRKSFLSLCGLLLLGQDTCFQESDHGKEVYDVPRFECPEDNPCGFDIYMKLHPQIILPITSTYSTKERYSV
jgi:hypothetical protein